MAINGTLTFPDVPGRISEHNSSTTAHSARIENNLTNPTEGKAADAKATKDLVENVSGQIEEEIDALNDEVTDLKSAIYLSAYTGNIVNILSWEGGTINGDGEDADVSGYFKTGYTNIVGRTIDITVGNNAVFVFEYKHDKTFILTDTGGNGGKEYTSDATHSFDNNACYVRFVIRKEPVDTSATVDIVNNSSIVGVFSYETIIKRNSDKIVDIDNKLYRYLNTIVQKNELMYFGYINSTNGDNYDNGSWRYSDYIDVSDFENIICTMPTFSSSNTGGMAFYKSDKTYYSGVAGRSTGEASYETVIIEVPSTAKYARFSFRYADISNFFVNVDEFYSISKQITKLNDRIDEINNPALFGMQLFEKIGVIGDSISVGWAKDINGNNSRRNTKISWVQQMARRLGCTAYNLGASGVDPVEWFQPNYEFAEYCYTQYQSVGFCDLYIIGLGLNPTSSIGTTADINQNDYTQNAETFYGQYARIIQTINHDHPNAIVMCLTEPTPSIANYDTAVRTICSLNFINAELVDLDADYRSLFTTDEIIAERQPDNLHYTPYGYSLIANAMVTALNDYISKNSAHFKYVGVTTV